MLALVCYQQDTDRTRCVSGWEYWEGDNVGYRNNEDSYRQQCQQQWQQALIARVSESGTPRGVSGVGGCDGVWVKWVDWLSDWLTGWKDLWVGGWETVRKIKDGLLRV